MQVINVCLGWACPLVTRCARSEFNEEAAAPGTWVRHYPPSVVGEHCAESTPLDRRWGDGPETGD